MKALEGGGEIGGRRMGKMEEEWRGGGVENGGMGRWRDGRQIKGKEQDGR